MRKIILTIILMLILTSCSQKPIDKEAGNVIRIWYYITKPNTGPTVTIEAAISRISAYAGLKDIKIEIKKYTADELSYDDYVLKRNMAISNNEADIIFDSPDDLYIIKDKAADYSKLSTYENIHDNYKDQYCIPLVILVTSKVINNKILKSYDITPSDEVISFKEYCDIKQKMKIKGAKFYLNQSEMDELIKYYINRNNIEIIRTNDSYTIDKDITKKIITEICKDMVEYYDPINSEYEFENDSKIIDTVSNEIISDKEESTSASHLSIIKMFILKNPEEFSFVLSNDLSERVSIISSVFINKSTANKNIYDMVSLLFTDEFQISMKKDVGVFSAPVIDTPSIRDYLELDSNIKYIGGEFKDSFNNIDTKSIKLYEQCYNLLWSTETDTDKLFENVKVKEALFDFVEKEVISTVVNPSHIDNFDRNFDSFLTNINVLYN